MCLPCNEDGLDLYPGDCALTFTEKYQASDTVKLEFLEYQKNKQAAATDEGFTPDYDQAEVGRNLKMTVRVAREGRFREEAEFEADAGINPKSVSGVPVFQFFDEDCNSKLKTYAIFPEDGSEEIQSFRKCTIFTDCEVYMNTVQLKREKCFGPNQGQTYLNNARDEEVKKRPANLRASSSNAWKPSDSFLTYSEAIEKGKALVQKKKLDFDKKRNPAADEMDNHSEEEEGVVVAASTKRRGKDTAAVPKKASKKAAAKAKLKQASSPAGVSRDGCQASVAASSRRSSKDSGSDGSEDDEDPARDEESANSDDDSDDESVGSRVSCKTGKTRENTPKGKGVLKKLISKAEIKIEKWMTKCSKIKKFMKDGNLGRTLNQALLYMVVVGVLVFLPNFSKQAHDGVIPHPLMSTSPCSGCLEKRWQLPTCKSCKY